MAKDDDVFLTDGVELKRSEVSLQLERMIASKHFRNSKRYPSLLRFVVEQTLAGNAEDLKERTLGISVFQKLPDYDTNADPIVRVTAGEIRKRIAQYYQEPEHRHEIRIDLPLGSYVPHFLAAEDAAAVSIAPHSEEQPAGSELDVLNGYHTEGSGQARPMDDIRDRSHGQTGRIVVIVWLVLIVLAILVSGLFSWRWLKTRESEHALDQFWKPALTASNPALIVIGVHTLDSTGHDIPPDVNDTAPHERSQSMLSTMINSDMLPVGDLVSYSKVTDLLTKHGRPYDTLASPDATLDDLRHGPVILVGGLDNVWTMRLISKLRYRFFAVGSASSGIVDSQHPSTVWTFDNTQRAISNSRDYAIVANYFDPSIEQHVFVVAGIGKTGTHAASEFMTEEKHIESWLRNSKIPADRNVEIILSTEILDGRSGPPEVVASYTW